MVTDKCMKYGEFLSLVAGNLNHYLVDKICILTKEKNLLPKFTIEDFVEFI